MTMKIPVTVLTGFLGSGKTTLLNRILSEQHGLRIAVIENEFGEIGIDQDLVINADEEVFETNNGCICCTVRGDLIRILSDLAARKDKFDRVILETTGMADPGPVAQTFFVDEISREHYELDGIITLVDAKHVVQHLNDSEEVVAQIAFADRIVLNKLDLVSEAEKVAIMQRLRGINVLADIYPAVMAETPIDRLLNVGGFNLQRVLEEKPNFLEPEYPFEWGGVFSLKPGKYSLQMECGPDPAMSLVFCELAARAKGKAKPSVTDLAEQVFPFFSMPAESIRSGDRLRKPRHHYSLELAEGSAFAFEIDVETAQEIAVFAQHTPDEFTMRLTRSNGVEIDPDLEHYFNAQHEHDSSVTSVSVELPGLFDMRKIDDWISLFLHVHGEDLFRMKGIVGIQGERVRFVFQSVHMMFNSQHGKPWGTEPPVNRLVFIGRDLNEDHIRKSLRACLA